MPTLRQRLLDQVESVLEALPDVGFVADAVAEADEQIGKTLAGDQHAIEWTLGDEDTDGVEQTITHDTVRCTVVVVQHLAEQLKPGGMSWQSFGADRHGRVVKAALADTGQWIETGSGEALALGTELRGGGLVFVNDRGIRCVLSQFDVTYRFPQGDPGVDP